MSQVISNAMVVRVFLLNDNFTADKLYNSLVSLMNTCWPITHPKMTVNVNFYTNRLEYDAATKEGCHIIGQDYLATISLANDLMIDNHLLRACTRALRSWEIINDRALGNAHPTAPKRGENDAEGEKDAD